MPIYFGGQRYNKAYIGGEEVSALHFGGVAYPIADATPPVARPTHTFSIVVGGRGNSLGYNAGNFGSIATGSDAAYRTPRNKPVTVIHCRRVRNVLNFSLRGAAVGAAGIADFPTRIVLTRGDTVIECTPGSAEPRSVTGGVRYDYNPASGQLTAVFPSGQTTRVDLYYA